MRRAVTITIGLLMLAATGCANTAPAQPAAAATGGSTATAAARVTTPPPPVNQIGQAFTNGGITVTVTAARTTKSIKLNESNYRAGSGYETYTDTPAGTGAAYVVVNAHVVNDAKVSLDLTCGYPIRSALVDDRDRNFDPIQDLYKIKGNPECNSQLQPGFASDMTWVYRVPEGTNVLGWAFEDVTDLSSARSSTPTVVRIQAPTA